MATVTPALIKELREKTNAGMLDCRAALNDADGNLEEAETILRKKGIVKAAKKAEREAKEGQVLALLSDDGKTGVLVEVNCETDFVAKNDSFTAFVRSLAQHVLDSPDATNAEAALSQTFSSDAKLGTVADVVAAKIGQLGENMILKRVARFQADANGKLASYIHLGGKVGVLLHLQGTTGQASEAVNALVKDLNLHIAFAKPPYLNRSQVSAEAVEKEREIAREQMKGKPAAAIEKIVEGKLSKYYGEFCLLDTPFIKDTDITIQQLLDKTGKETGQQLSIKEFACFAVGDK